MIMLLILIMGSAYFLLTKLNKGDPQQPRMIDATEDLGTITAALIGYALTHNHCLPCPDTNNDGIAETSCGSGPPIVGTLPWVTLNTGMLDSWGHRLRYVVDPAFTDPGSGLCTNSASLSGQIRVDAHDNAGNSTTLTNDAPALILAFGANGYGATDESGAVMPNPPASHADELSNITANSNFIQRVASNDPAAVNGPFDDLLAWVPLAPFQTQLAKVPLP